MAEPVSKRTIRPLSDRVVLKRIVAREETEAGLLIPDNAVEKPQVADVIAVGPGWKNGEGVRTPMDVVVGDRVVFAKYTIGEIKLDGVELVMVREDEILAVIGKRDT
jgi:chaperonin GroES